MSVSAELQKAVLAALLADSAVAAIVGTRVFDRMPADGDYPCVTFGPSDYTLSELTCLESRVEALQIDCWTRADGRIWPARELADAVVAALHNAALSMAVNAFVTARVDGVRVFLDADGVTAHGVVTLEAVLEAA
jgi:hypothetical protein